MSGRHVGDMSATFPAKAGREISGLVLEWLALYRAVLPKATLAECCAFLYNDMDPNEPPYSNSQVYRAEQLLDLKRKAASTFADFATSQATCSSVSCIGQCLHLLVWLVLR